MMIKIMFPAGRPRTNRTLSLAFTTFSSALLLAALIAQAAATDSGASVTAATAAPPPAPVVTDWRTGIALYGFDPVAYFSRRAAVPGLAAHEVAVEGVTWRFLNEGNRAAFAADPQTYGPRFGGYDPVALGRGTATAGNPLVWTLAGERLYLFHDAQTRAAFLDDPAGAAAAADAQWPRLRETVAP